MDQAAVLVHPTVPPPQPVPAVEARQSLTRLAVAGSAWTLVGYGAGQVLRLGGNVLLSRLLFPEAFGVMALVSTFLIGLEMFSDLGIGTSVIQSKDGGRREFLDTAWTIQIVRGVGLWLLACAIAWPVAWTYGERELLALLPVSGFCAVIAGFYSTSLLTLNRRMAFRTITLLDVGAQLISIITMVAWALFISRSVWALAAGSIAAGLLRLVVGHWISRHEPDRVRWDPQAAHELFRFGKWIFLSTLLTFVVGQSDRLVFGKVQEMGWLGTYSIAVTLAALPTMVILKIGGSVTFPAYSRVLERGGDLPSAFRKSRLPLLMVAGLMVTGLIVTGPSAITMLYDNRYHGAGVLLQLLAVGVWFQVLECTNGAVLLALGKPGIVALGNGVKLVTMTAGLFIGFRLGGIHGAILGIAAADAARYGVSAWAVSRKGLGSFTTDLMLTLLVVGACFASIAVLKLFPGHLPGERVTRFFLSALPVLAIWAIPMARAAWEHKGLRDRAKGVLTWRRTAIAA